MQWVHGSTLPALCLNCLSAINIYVFMIGRGGILWPFRPQRQYLLKRKLNTLLKVQTGQAIQHSVYFNQETVF